MIVSAICGTDFQADALARFFSEESAMTDR